MKEESEMHTHTHNIALDNNVIQFSYRYHLLCWLHLKCNVVDLVVYVGQIL